ncbi:hypothetical protein GS473_24630 [Rhodococcus hoagii]|nr:hypothetical protein [Prescottella equi]
MSTGMFGMQSENAASVRVRRAFGGQFPDTITVGTHHNGRRAGARQNGVDRVSRQVSTTERPGLPEHVGGGERTARRQALRGPLPGESM